MKSECHEWKDGSRRFFVYDDGSLFELDDEGAGPQIGEVPRFVATEILCLARDKRLALHAADKLAAKVAELEEEVALLAAIVAPLLPLFRERAEAWARTQEFYGDALPDPRTITLTAEFPTSALRALLDRNEQKEEG